MNPKKRKKEKSPCDGDELRNVSAVAELATALCYRQPTDDACGESLLDRVTAPVRHRPRTLSL